MKRGARAGDLLLVAEEAPAAGFAPRHLELVLPGQEPDPRAHQRKPSEDLARGIDPGVLADQSDLVDAHARLDRVVDAVDRAQLLAEAGLGERAGAVLVR